MANKNQAKKEIKKLINKYESLTPTRRKKISEADTRRMFIMPLFRTLGWDVDNVESENEVVEEETSISGRTDYSFRLNNITQFVLEAKAIPENLEKEKWAKQAIEYGWNKGITWVVLSDFEGTKLFNSDWKVDSPHANLDLSYKDYLARFDDLWFLSKESFEKGELDNQASKWGIKAKRVSVNEKLAEDLLRWREELTKNLSQWNEDRDKEIIDESVQRILDRLIFIRVVEDRKIEDKILWQEFQRWEAKDNEPQNFIKLLAPIFRDFDKKYNSNLFRKHVCEDLVTEGGPFKKLIPQLYGKKEAGVKYRFDAIDADVLGNVYEQYLGYVQGRDGGKSKRKKQGIYYTPTYIVEYIIQNTLGRLLEEKSLTEVEAIKVLDPACGSGSFLIKAFDVLNEKIKKERGGKNGVQVALRKYRILKSNIFGVDLDPQAVEIARLNLLLKALEPNHKLPMLTENIKMGNSLIDDKKIFEKPFAWNEEFEDIVEKGGFDLIIGNPPYISFYSRQSQATPQTKKELQYLIENYDFIQDKSKLGRFNTLMFFLEKSLKLSKKNGYIGLIVDTNLHSNPSLDVRRYIAENTEIVKIVDEIRAFKGVASSQVILIMKKKTPGIKNSVTWEKIEKGKFKSVNVAEQAKIIREGDYSFKAPQDDKIQSVLEKISKQPRLEKLVGRKYIRTCITFTGKKDYFVKNRKELDIDYPLLEGSSSLPYPYAPLTWIKLVRYDRALRDKLNEKYLKEAVKENRRSPKVIGLGDLSLFKSPKIFIRLSDDRITASYTDKLACGDLSLYILTLPNLKKETKDLLLLYLLSVLNTKTVTFYMRKSNRIKNLRTGTPQIRLKDVRSIPIPKPSRKIQNRFAENAQILLTLNREVFEIQGNTDKKARIKKKIEKVRNKLDKLAYNLYGLSDREIKIVEKS